MSSLARQIQEAAFSRIVKAMGSQFKATRKTPLETFEVDKLPALAVYLLRETLTADGDANVGEPRFKGEALLGIGLIDSTSDPKVVDGYLDYLLDAIEETLFSDPSFVRLNTPDSPTGVPLIEGFPQMVRTPTYHKDGESYYLEMRLQVSCSYRCYFPPNAPNALTEVAVTVQPFGPGPSGQPAEPPDTTQLQIDLPGS